MLDDDSDKDMMRRQMRAMLIIGAILMGWMYFFQPPPVVEQPVDPAAPAVVAESESTGPSSALPETPSVASEPGAPVQWPNLPEVPVIDDPASEEVILENDNLQLVFTKIGARLKEAHVKLSTGVDETFQMVPSVEDTPDTEAVYPFGVRFTHSDVRDALDIRRFEVKVSSRDSVTFVLTLPNALELTKTFTLSEHSHVLDVDIAYTNLEGRSRLLGLDLDPAYTLNWGPGINSPNSGRLFKPSVLWNPEGEPEPEKQYLNDLPDLGEAGESRGITDVDWMGQRSKYFLAAFKNGGEGTIDGWFSGTQEDVRFGVMEPRFEIAPNETHESSYQVYLGPMHLRELTEAWANLPNALTFFDYPNFLDTFAKLLLRNLNWWHGFVGNYGVAIILLTILLRMIILPLTLKSMRSMKAMQSLQPELAELKESFDDTPEGKQDFAKAQMEMFRERGVNPLGGCLPLFLQMPIFIALYRMIMNAFEMRGATFLWIEDLSFPDRLIHVPFMADVPFIGQYIEYINILPILMVIAMVFSMKLTSSSAIQNPQQQMMMRIMPIFFGVVSYPFSAGINLYVLTSTVLGIAQQQVINRTGTAEPKPPKKKKKSLEDVKKKRKQHFYNRAQERKREQVKEERRSKNKKKKK